MAETSAFGHLLRVAWRSCACLGRAAAMAVTYLVDIALPAQRAQDAQTQSGAKASSQPDATIRAIDAGGRRRWAHESGYTLRSLVETAMSRYKTIIGDSVRSRTMTSQKVEAALACAILNKMAQLGMPDGHCIA